METQHEVVDERSERVRTLLEDWRKDPADGTELAAVLDDFTDALVEHLDDEEIHARNTGMSGHETCRVDSPTTVSPSLILPIWDDATFRGR